MTERKHLAQLDSLRALAVLAVACHHWLPNLGAHLPLGTGVPLFFVLSGFLITGILLDGKEAIERGHADRGAVLRNFYARRFLRIFPLYYAVLLIALALNVEQLRDTFAWHFLYLSNFSFMVRQDWQGSLSHFWTLAVEEQFYLFWPLLILLVPRDRLPFWLVVFVTLAPLYKLIGLLYFPEVKLWNVGTPGSFDSLALGALLAYFRRYPTALFERLQRSRGAIFMVGVAGFCIIEYTELLPAMFSAVKLTVLSLAFCVLIHGAAAGFTGNLGKLLNMPTLQYVGKISYGLYIFHNFAAIPTAFVLAQLGIAQPFTGLPVLLNAFFTGILAALSWHCFERPINELKKYFPPASGAATTETAARVRKISRVAADR
jgi:peptidoglycan/LPS O-acetylase OafA/YrhL